MELTVLRDLSVLWCLVHILILFMLLYRSRYSQKKTLILTTAAMTPVIIVNVTGLMLLGTDRMGRLFFLTCTLPSLFFFYYMSRDRRGRFLFTFCLSDTVAYWIIIVTNLLDHYIGGGYYILMFAGRLVLFPLLEWWADRKLRRPYLELQDSVGKGWNVFAGMAALYYLLLVAMANFPEIIIRRPQEMPAFVLVLILMPMTYATIFTAMYRQLLLYRRQKNDSVYLEVRQQMEALLANQKHIHRLKHDMKAHIITLSGLMSSDRVEEARTYLEKLLPDHDTSGEYYCSNPYINAVLGHYVMKFDELGVGLRLDIQTGDEILPHMELCQILSNGLENAYEESRSMGKEQKVSVQVRYNKGWLLVRIKNKCREGMHVEKGSFPGTHKKEPGHGLGLRTIQEAAGSLGGDMSCYTEEGYFILDVMVRGG